MEMSCEEETKVIYHIDEEDTPYLVKLNKAPDQVTLGDLKSVLPAHLGKYKYFFKSKDDDFGVVKEEVLEDSSKLPLFNGRVVSWLVAAEGSMIDEERGIGVGETRPPSFHGNLFPNGHKLPAHCDDDDLIDEEEDDEDDEDTESAITSVSQLAAKVKNQAQRAKKRSDRERLRANNGHNNGLPPRLPGPGIPAPNVLSSLNTMDSVTDGQTSSMMSSEIESSLYDDTEDGQSLASSSRFTTSTEHTSVSRNMMHRQKKRSRRKVPAHLNRAGSISSVTDSTQSLNLITVTLNMDTVNFLGISIVGQSNKFGDGDCGIYVGSIMKGGAVALDGRIEPGDMILQVNDINFEKMSNDDAVKVLKEVVQKPGPIKLIVAKCWDQGQSSKGYFTIPRTEPVRPIDPGAWVAHTAAVRGDYPGRANSVATLSSASVVSSQPETEKYLGGVTGPTHLGMGVPAESFPLPNLSDQPLSINSGMHAIVHKMSQDGSGLEIRDRTWLKIKISNAFIGSDVVEWLNAKVDGFQDRREARKYAVQMLKNGYIKPTAHKTTFSEQCYYTFNNQESSIHANMANLKLNDGDADPLPPPPLNQTPAPLPLASGGSGGSGGVWGAGHMGAPVVSGQNSGPGWEMPWTGPPSGGTGSTTTYGPIYNPAAPPPSATYMAMPQYQPYPGVVPADSNYSYQHQPSVSSSGSSQRSHRSNNHLRLAGSGSGSESASDGRNSNFGSERSSLVPSSHLAGLRPVVAPTIPSVALSQGSLFQAQ